MWYIIINIPWSSISIIYELLGFCFSEFTLLCFYDFLQFCFLVLSTKGGKVGRCER